MTEIKDYKRVSDYESVLADKSSKFLGTDSEGNVRLFPYKVFDSEAFSIVVDTESTFSEGIIQEGSTFIIPRALHNKGESPFVRIFEKDSQTHLKFLVSTATVAIKFEESNEGETDTYNVGDVFIDSLEVGEYEVEIWGYDEI